MTEAAEPPTVDRLLVEVTIAAPADTVWDAILDGKDLQLVRLGLARAHGRDRLHFRAVRPRRR